MRSKAIQGIELGKILKLVPVLLYTRDCRHLLTKQHRNVRAEALHWDLLSISLICTQASTLETLCNVHFESVSEVPPNL